MALHLQALDSVAPSRVNEEVVGSTMHQQVCGVARPGHPKWTAIQHGLRVRRRAHFVDEQREAPGRHRYEGKPFAIRRPERVVDDALGQKAGDAWIANEELLALPAGPLEGVEAYAGAAAAVPLDGGEDESLGVRRPSGPGKESIAGRDRQEARAVRSHGEHPTFQIDVRDAIDSGRRREGR